MKKYATMMILAASLGFSSAASAEEEKKRNRPAPGGEATAEKDGDARPRPDRPPGGPEGRRPGGDRPGGPGGDRPGQRPGFLEMIRDADTDGDKKVSAQEWKAASVKRAEDAFNRLDGDEDGFITQKDIEKMRERFSGGRPGGDRPQGDRPPRGNRPPGGPEGRGPREGGDDAAGGPKRPKRPEVE